MTSSESSHGSGSTGRQVELLQRAAELLATGARPAAAELLAREYPTAPAPDRKRSYTERQMMRVFFRDGFLDRYTGQRLVHPAALRALSFELPDAFPYHPNGKYGLGHQAFWELFPSIDHLVPVARGGADEFDNWVTSSMLNNARKANWLLEELEWKLQPPGDLGEWDGLSSWFVRWVDQNSDRLDAELASKGTGVRYLRRWQRATLSTFDGT